MLTTQKQIRALFWESHPTLSRRKIRDYAGTGRMYMVDTRCAFVDFVDYLQTSGQINKALANRVTL